MPDRGLLPDRARVERLRNRLLAWYASERRDLPWRRTRDPYAVWISEAMLQQTRVETVLPYYQRFLARFPSLEALAASEEDEVLTLWSGLGYYSRARALREAARAIVTRHGGEPPRTRDEWEALPGVGPYTAGAVLSIAFGSSEPLVDGNVQRVFARLFALKDPRGSPALTKQSWTLARALVPEPSEALGPGDWNQALMELGARLCTPRTPACDACPVRGHCRARTEGRVDELPRARPRRAPVDVRLEMFVVRARGRILCVRRPSSGRMANLFELPTRELVADGSTPLLWPAETPLPVRRSAAEPLAELTHAITHHRIQARVFAARRERGRLPPNARWATAEELEELARTGLTKKVLARLADPTVSR